eukprot:COSAG03_NODE_14025_length_479_cov_3.113158_2_plen_111_part_01
MPMSFVYLRREMEALSDSAEGHTERHRETEAQRDGQRHRKTHTERDTQRDTERHRERDTHTYRDTQRDTQREVLLGGVVTHCCSREVGGCRTLRGQSAALRGRRLCHRQTS